MLTIKDERVCLKQFNIDMPRPGTYLCAFGYTVIYKNRLKDATELRTVAILNHFLPQDIIHLDSGRTWWKRCMRGTVHMTVPVQFQFDGFI